MVREVERILDNLVAKIASIGSRCDRTNPNSGKRLFRGRAPRFGWRLSGHKIAQQLDGIGPNGPHDSNELDDINPALAALVFGDKGLRTLQAAREFMLGQAGLLAGSHH
jgi:hypothetical protein